MSESFLQFMVFLCVCALILFADHNTTNKWLVVGKVILASATAFWLVGQVILKAVEMFWYV